MKRVMPVSLWCLVIVSCTSQIIPNSVATVPPQSLVITPEITATPVLFYGDVQDLIPILADAYHRSVACLTDNEIPMPNNVTELVKPEIRDVTNEMNDPVEMDEIADSTNNAYRAYLAVCDTDQECKWGQHQLYLENRSSGRTYLVTWKGFESLTAHWNLIWIGEDIIAYMHTIDPRREEIIAINVKTEEFAYVGQAWAYCVEP